MTIRQRITRLLTRKPAPVVIDTNRKRAHIVIDGEAVKGYSLPEPDERDLAIAEREWGEHHAILAEQERTRTQRLAGRLLQHSQRERERDVTKAMLAAACKAYADHPDEAHEDRMRRAIYAARVAS